MGAMSVWHWLIVLLPFVLAALLIRYIIKRSGK